MLAVVGLGNPGAGYKNSRHNAGYMLLDGIVEGRFFTDAVIQKSRRRDCCLRKDYLTNRQVPM